jgi:Uma2 family endonuclease
MQAQAPTTERVGMSLAEFSAEFDKQPFELIDGKRIPILPDVFGPSSIMNTLYRKMLLHSTSHERGDVYSKTTVIRTAHEDRNWVVSAYVPDLIVYDLERIEHYKQQQPDYLIRPLELVPDLAIEVVSPSDKYTDINNKVKAYMADGVQIVWVIDGQTRSAVVYTADAQPLHLDESGTPLGDDVLPEFELPLSDLFT